MSDKQATVGVLGAGAWGTALAQMLASDGREVLLWALEPELVEEINGNHTNSVYLPLRRLRQQSARQAKWLIWWLAKPFSR